MQTHRPAATYPFTGNEPVALPLGHLVPLFILGQRQGGDQADHIVQGGLLLEIDADILIQQAGLAKRGTSGEPMQLAAAIGVCSPSVSNMLKTPWVTQPVSTGGDRANANAVPAASWKTNSTH